MRIPPIGALIACTLLITPAAADWPPEGVPVYGGATGYPAARIEPSPTGGFVLPFEFASPGSFQQKLRRVASDGTLDPAWFATALGEPGTMQPDGAGGWFVLRRAGAAGGSVHAYRLMHVLASGALDPAWPDSGAAVSSFVLDANKPALAPDGAGGAYVLYEYWRDTPPTGASIRLARFAAGGAAAPGWPAGGVVLRNNSFSGLAQGLAADGAGGAFAVIAWAVGNGVQYMAHHWRADGTVDPNWTVLGIDLGTWPFTTEPLRLVAHGSEATLIWRTGALNAPASSVLRFDARLDLGERWYHIVPMGTEVGGVSAFDDGSGGLYLLWLQRVPVSDIRGVRLLARGAFAPGWESPTASRLPDDAAFDRERPWAAGPDAAGGVALAWVDPRPVNGWIHVARRTGAGVLAGGWPAEGMPAPIADALHGAARSGAALAARADAAGRIWLAWHTEEPADDQLYLTPILPATVAGVPEPIPGGPAFRLSPNPTARELRVTLAEPAGVAGARIELLDLAGRRRAATTIASGVRELRWTLPPGLAPGVHFVRVLAAGGGSTRRIVVTR